MGTYLDFFRWLVQLFLVALFCCWHYFLSKVLSFYFSGGVCAFFVVCGYYLSKGPKLPTNGVHKYEMANYVAASKSVGGSQGTIYICRLFVRYIAIIGTPPASQCLEDHNSSIHIGKVWY